MKNRYFSITESRTPDGFTVTLVTDVTEREQGDRRLRESEERYRALIDLSPDAIFLHVDDCVVVCNKAAVEMFGADTADDLIGRDLVALAHPDFRAELRERRDRVLHGGGHVRSARQKRLRLDGTEFWVDIAASGISRCRSKVVC